MATAGVTYRLVRPPVDPVAAPELDPTQQVVVDHDQGPLLVLAGPGTGKTTTLVEAVVERVRCGAAPDEVLVLTFSRKAADELRSRIAGRLGRTVVEPAASTFHSFCYSLLRNHGVAPGDTLPRLLSGAERELRVRELLEGDATGEGKTRWPAELAPALRLRGFAKEVCDVLDRAGERGLDPAALRARGREHGRPAWVAAGDFLAEYLEVLSLRNEVDYSGVIDRALDLLTTSAQPVCRKYKAVYVDEYQDTDPSQEQLLRLLAGDGRLLVAVGDPDQSIYGFRGADVRGIIEFPDRFPTASGQPAPVTELQVCRRSGPALVALSRAVATKLPLGRLTPRREAHRGLQAAGPDGPAPEIRLFSSVAAEVTGVADLLRRAHLIDGVAWSRMAVLVRSGVRSISTVRRALVAAGIPVSVAADELPLSRDPAVAPLLRALEIVDERTRGERAPAGREVRAAQPMTPDVARMLLTSPLAGASPSQLRALGRRLREIDRIANNGLARPSPTLIAEALDDPSAMTLIEDWVAAPVLRLTRLLNAAIEIQRRGGSPAEVLWALWDGSDWSRRLSTAAMAADAEGRAADRDLDAVLALFELAGRLEDKQPRATVGALLGEVSAQEIPASPYEEKAGSLGAVRLLTAHRSKGLEWDLVVVAGVQEAVWPDLRRRGSLLDADGLALDSPGAGPDAGSLLTDERRLFYVAVTRARKRLVLTATSGTDDLAERPSRLLTETGLELPDSVTTTTGILSTPSLVARLRRALRDPDLAEDLRQVAAECLAELADAVDDDGTPLVPTASPDHWWGLPAETPGAVAVRDPDRPLELSASAVSAFDRCPRAWFLDREAKATESTSTAQGFGSIVHALAEAVVVGELPADIDVLVERLDEVWHLLPYDAKWQAVRDHREARAALERFLAWHALNDRECADAEVSFEVAVGSDVVVRGRADRIELDADGGVVVVDLKTTRNPPSDEKVKTDAQLGVYQLVTRHGAFKEWSTTPGGAELVQLRKSVRGAVKVQRQDALEAGDEWVDDLVDSIADGIRTETFPARANEGCGYCRFRTSCPASDEGSQVMP
ncbi:MAG TPA: ATP-dependent DNA helicase [Mycobacteriales bacterium]|nr:ATP-dependent DNA helicase [Mycobacteriales bacterium]